MILMDPSHMLLKTSPVPDPLAESVLTLDDEIKSILDSSTLPDHEKVLQYDQALRKYLTRVNQTNTRQWNDNFKASRPASIQQPNPATANSEKTVKLEKRLIDSLPKTLQTKGRLLLDHIKEATELNWNDRGELLNKGATINGSNVSDLIHETLRARKLSEVPIGWETYANVLKQSNVPNDLIGNKVRWEAPLVEASPFKSPVPSASTPKKHRRRSKKDSAKAKQRFWESF